MGLRGCAPAQIKCSCCGETKPAVSGFRRYRAGSPVRKTYYRDVCIACEAVAPVGKVVRPTPIFSAIKTRWVGGPPKVAAAAKTKQIGGIYER